MVALQGFQQAQEEGTSSVIHHRAPKIIEPEEIFGVFRSCTTNGILVSPKGSLMAKDNKIMTERLDEFFVDFLACHAPHGKGIYFENLKKGVLRNYVTVTTEAFAMFDRENHATTYDSLGGTSKGGYGKYTPRGRGAKQFAGVSDDGLRRFSELCALVQTSRESATRKHYESGLYSRIMDKAKAAKKRTLEPPVNVKVFNELDVIRRRLNDSANADIADRIAAV